VALNRATFDLETERKSLRTDVALAMDDQPLGTVLSALGISSPKEDAASDPADADAAVDLHEEMDGILFVCRVAPSHLGREIR
jgi:hypothetical protein